MVCRNCGSEVREDMKFCVICGARQAAPTPQPVQQAAPQPTPQAAPQPTPQAAPQPTPQAAPQPAPQPVPQAAPQHAHGMNFDFNTNTAAPAASKRYQYKVLSQKDKWFTGKFDPTVLEQALNAYAQQGWRVIGCATADIASFGSARQEFITLLEREV